MPQVDTAAAASENAPPTRATARERALVPIRYAVRRLRHNAGRAVVAAIGIAVGAGVLALTQVGSTAVQDRALQRALAELQPSDRAIQAVWSGVPAQSSLSLPKLDAIARNAVTPIIGAPPFRVEVFRAANWGGVYVNLGALDGLQKWINVASGRLPKPCRPLDCELVQVGGAPAAPKIANVHVVGRASFVAGAPLSAYFGAAVPGGKPPPILLANGVLGLSRFPLPDGAIVARTYGWIVPVAPNRVHDWQLASLSNEIDRAQADLERRSDIFTITGPTDTISSIRATSRVAAQRLLILGGDAAVLLLGFAVLASARLRRDQHAVRERMTWSGATRVQILLVAATESLVVTVAASAAGWLVGTAGGALLARHLGAPPGLIISHSLATGRAIGIGVALAAVTAIVMLAALRADELAVAGARITVADTAAVGALAAVLLALARGKADASSLQQGGTGVLLLLLPGLVLFVLAVAAARLLAPLLRGLERISRRTRPGLRIALLSLARAPGEVALAVVFFVLSIGIAVFALAYRATLVQGEHDQALYAVPAPYVLQEDLTQLRTIQQAAPTLPGTRLLRDDGTIAGGKDFTLLALPASAIPHVDGWRGDFSTTSRPQLAALLQPHSSMRLNGAPVPGTFRFTIRGDRIGVTLVVRNTAGDFTQVDLGQHASGTYERPTHLRSGQLIAVKLYFPTIAAYVASHKEAETGTVVSDASVGTLKIHERWLGSGGIRVDAPGVYHYVVNRAADSVIRPRQPADGELVPVITSPGLGKIGATVGLRVSDAVIPATIVAHARHFPSIDADFVIADLPTWLAAANGAEPGVATPSEIWTDRKPPALPLQVTSQRAQKQQLEEDPIARGAIALLLVVAVVALLLAVSGLLLTVLGDRSGERASLRDLEVQGATPAEQRRHLRLRAAVVGTLGVGGGIGAGAIVGTLVVAVVTVTAGAQQALPPLALSFDWPLVAFALAALVVTAAAGTIGVTRR
jgi:hypothetical protein